MLDLGFVRGNLELVEAKQHARPATSLTCCSQFLFPDLCSLFLQIISPFCWTIILRGNRPGAMRLPEAENGA
jgi:hypothetical protein